LNTPLFILQISDCHLLEDPEATLSGINTTQSLQQVLKHAYEQHGKADLILVTGDLAQEPCQSSYQRLFAALQKYQTRSICLPGNHDDLSLMQQYINSKTINCNKHILFPHWQTICLNSKKTGSPGGYLAANEFTFLTETLSRYPELNTLVAIHHHCIPTQSLWMDSMMIENNDELLSLLKQYPQVKAITGGHIHQELEMQSNNQLILGMPSTCFQFKPLSTEYTLDDKTPGYRVLLLYPEGEIKTHIYHLPENA
jgi:Icc protein